MAITIVNQLLDAHGFRDYVSQYHFGSKPPYRLVVHHTWRPTVETWAGQRTILGLKRYYEGKGWNAAPHLFVAPEGIWLFSPMNKDGVHAGTLNPYSIGIEVVGDYDQKVWEGKVKENALAAIRILADHLKIGTDQIFFHRDASKKSCPGKAITKEWLFNELSKFRLRPKVPKAATSSVQVTLEVNKKNSAPVIPDWAEEAVNFVKANNLFQIKTEDDVRDAVKFYRFHQLENK